MAQVANEPVVGPDVLVPAGAPGEPAPRVVGLSPGQLFWRRFRRDRFALAGIVFIVIMGALALAAPLIANFTGHGPNDTSLFREMTDEFGLPKGPNSEFWFGADKAGRDVFIRVLYGAQTSLFVALFATTISLFIGVSLGLTAGYYRGKVDTFISRLIDVVLSLPVLLLALGLVAACGLSRTGCLGGVIRPGRMLVSYVIGLFSWPYIARIVRGQVLSLREKEFIEAARAQGASNRRIIRREILPNVVAPIIVYTTLIIPNNIIFEAALSFLGIGVPITTPSWGRMLSDAANQDIYTVAWWTMAFPGLFLFLTTLAFNLVGDGLRDALDPRTAR
ncbi:MAG TPA: ABC transporter permease [Actinomycetota bacterium]|nr:ABC transporter permease [Actinomycetota bacterium]